MTTLRVTFLRTSCLLLQYDGFTAITDPWFGRSMRGLPVFRRPGVALADLPRIDGVIASHLHRDHFDRAAVRAFGHPELDIVGTPGTAGFCSALVPDSVREVRETPPWASTTLGPLRLTATPAEHTGPPPPEVNYVVQAGDLQLFFGGDARWSGAYAEVRERFGPMDVALLPIGGTLIFGTRTTLSPRDAARAATVLGARFVVPIHPGGEWLPVPPASWHPGRNHHFVRDLARERGEAIACVLEPGEAAEFRPGEAGFIRPT